MKTIPYKDLIEDMMFMSMRYSIGRSSISSQMLPSTMAKFIAENKDNFKNTLDGFLDDIIREMNSRIVSCTDVVCDFNPWERINLMGCILEFLKDHPKSQNEKIHICKDMKIRLEPIDENPIPLSELLDILRPWSDLVGGFRPTHIFTTKNGDIEGFLSYSKHSITNENIFCKSVEEYLKNPYTFIYINNESILKSRSI